MGHHLRWAGDNAGSRMVHGGTFHLGKAFANAMLRNEVQMIVEAGTTGFTALARC